MIGTRLKLARTSTGLSLRELAERMGNVVSAQAIGKYERNEDMPGSRPLMALARALGVSESYLLSDEELTLEGILLTMYEAGNPATERVVHYVREHLPRHLVFDMPIPRTPATADAFAAGQPVVLRNPADPASQAYVNLAMRLAERFA